MEHPEGVICAPVSLIPEPLTALAHDEYPISSTLNVFLLPPALPQKAR